MSISPGIPIEFDCKFCDGVAGRYVEGFIDIHGLLLEGFGFMYNRNRLKIRTSNK